MISYTLAVSLLALAAVSAYLMHHVYMAQRMHGGNYLETLGPLAVICVLSALLGICAYVLGL